MRASPNELRVMARKSTSSKTSKNKRAAKRGRAGKPIRVGIVGLGRAGWYMHCPQLERRPHKYAVVAACDTVPLRRQRAAERFGCEAYPRIEQLVADGNVELVDIATRSCDHFDHASLALRAGKCVLLEKPMAVTYDQARRLRSLARRSPGDLYIHHNRRFEPGFMHVLRIIRSGILGEVYEIKLRRLDYQFRGDWQTLKRFGGGQACLGGPEKNSRRRRRRRPRADHSHRAQRTSGRSGDQRRRRPRRANVPHLRHEGRPDQQRRLHNR